MAWHYANALIFVVKLIKATGEIAEQGLHDLLCKSDYNQEEWLTEAKQLLWQSDRVPEVSVYVVLGVNGYFI